MKKPKIGFVTINQSAPWGGSEELWSQAAMYLVQQGYSVGASVKHWQPVPSQIQDLEQAGCAITYRWSNRSPWHRLRAGLSKGKVFHRWLDQFRPDLVVISQGINIYGADWMAACANRNIPYINLVHSAAENYWPSDEAAKALAGGYQRAQKSFFVSHRNIALTEKQLAVKLDQAQVIRNPFKVSYQAAPAWPQATDSFSLACVGRLDPVSKGQDILFEVLRADKWRHRPLKVTLYGGGSNPQSLRALKDLWHLDNVEFGHHVNNIEAIWEQHHALILPSRYEGLPLVIVEAMLCGRPCIVTDVAGNTELVEDNVNGFVARAPQAEFLDEALERAWENRESWYAMGKAAAEKVRQEVPPDPVSVFAREIEAVLKDLTTSGLGLGKSEE